LDTLFNHVSPDEILARRAGPNLVHRGILRRALILGSGGQLGTALVAAPWPHNWTVHAFDHPRLDITERDQVERALALADPDLVVNAAAHTDVDGAEIDPEAAYAVNRDGAALVAEACSRRQVALIHISAADVFDGELTRPWREDDPVSPINVCGASKAAGELEVRRRLEPHVILRTSWLFGATGASFVRTMLTLGAERPALRVVAGEMARPTAAQDLAEAVIRIADRLVGGVPAWGTFHFANTGEESRAGFAEAILRMAGLATRVEPIPAAEWVRPAPRPANAVLDCAKIERIYGIEQRPWREALTELLPLVAPQRVRRAAQKS
jgi:dTDP-4-dehydrorhamnose reductase